MPHKVLLFLLAACLVLGLAIGFFTPVGAGTAQKTSIAIQAVDGGWLAALPTDPDAATAAYLARLAPEARARSDAYFTGGYWLQGWNLLLTLATMAVLVLTGASVAMRSFAERLTKRKPLQTSIYVVQFVVATWILDLPMTIYEGFLREHRYGFATQRFGPWMGEQLLSLAVSLIFGAILGALIYGVLRRFRTSWVMLATGVATLFAIVGIVIAPVFVDPLFNTYKPMAEGPTKSAILHIARANGVPVSNVLQFDASRQTTRVSANVSGLFGTAAVRLNDNLVKRCTLPEIKAVMAHEVGHYVLNHIPKMLLVIFLVLAAGFAFLKVGFPWVAARWGGGVTDIADLAGLPVIVALFSLYMFVASPVMVGIVRVQETEADYFSLNASLEPDGFAEAQLKLIEYRKADPGVLEEILFYDHPSPRLRIRSAMQWKAEHLK